MTTPSAQNPRYEAHENPPILASLGFALQFSLIASATLLITPVIVAQESGESASYVEWMVFASLLVVGAATLLQVRRLGPVGAGAVLPLAAAPFTIPFCITALTDGGPATLAALLLVTAVFQIVISRWLFILRRIVTPTVGGTVMMILSTTLASVIFGLLDESSQAEPTAAPLTALATLLVVAVITLRGSAVMRLWAPVAAIIVGCITAAILGIYNPERVMQAPWVGLPSEWPGVGLDFGISFWTLLPAFLFLGIVISIQVNGESIASQRVSHRERRAVDFREVQGALSGAGVANLLASIVGAVPNIINAGIVSFVQITGVASRRVGYCIGAMFILMAFVPKASGLLSTLPGPVMTGYLIMVIGALFVEGARTVIQTGLDRQKIMVVGVSYWIGTAFQFGLFELPNLGSAWETMLSSGITTGGLAAMLMTLFLEFTNQRRMRFQSRLDAEVLPELNEFITKFAKRRGWNPAMQERLNAVAEETLLTLAPIDLSLDDEESEQSERQLIVLASSEGPVAELEFIGGASEENLEDQIQQLRQHDEQAPSEQEISLRLLRHYASDVQHQQYHDTQTITVQVEPPEAG